MNRLRVKIFKILYFFGIGHFLLTRNRRKGRVPVLVLHKVVPEHDEAWPGMHPRLFRDMILMLKEHYEILPASMLLTAPPDKLKKACFITFDDGYKDFLDYAYPILKENKAPASLFVLPYDLSNRGHIWTSTIIYFVKHYWFNDVRAFFHDHGQAIDFGNRVDDFNVNLAITQHLCRLRHAERKVIIDALMEKFEKDSHIIEKELLDFPELRKLDPALVEIESHSLTHPSFSLETDEAFIEYEICESREIIQKELKAEARYFAFPFTSRNAIALEKVRQYYQAAFTRINDFVDLNKLKSDKSYHYDLPRFHIHQESVEEIFFLINGFHSKFNSKLRS